MNIIFFSPHFPQNSTYFCINLKNSGANVLGIGDTAYEALGDKLKEALTDYIQIRNLEDYDEVLKSVGYFTHKFGKIDRFESLNDHWLELEAKIRTDFNIFGTKLDLVYDVIHKSKMKKFFEKCDVSTIRSVKDINITKSLNFIKTVGYPIVIKPDLGAGASMTSKINNERELDQFFEHKPAEVNFIAEEFIDGNVLTYDGLIDRDGVVRLAATHLFDQSIMKVVNTNDHLHYYCLKEVPTKVSIAGQSILRAFDIKERFFHIELFESKKNGNLYALEVNMRPPGAWMPDAINFTYDIDVYKEWANMVVHNHVDTPKKGKYFTAYASRKDHKHYVHSHEDILSIFSPYLVNHNRIEDVFSQAMGNYAFQFRADTLEKVQSIVSYVQEEMRN
ncbi:acetyl-CoA carboxylase biotin carboxylase subunit family protein [Paenisporosarcina sp. TG20]|uniref:ATP-grasp domain-containing protein n=1 Tax=Paenisporosarcina sp. TG20 TaxID=1211706 RepID=UPI00031C54E5|nr:ATP-grasp domain-containing protein [Paenisporosarcina sp. TG20]